VTFAAVAAQYAALVRKIVNSFARDYRLRGAGVDYDDLHSLALAALWRASEQYDPEQGELGAYARATIRLALSLELQRAQRRVDTRATRLDDADLDGWSPAALVEQARQAEAAHEARELEHALDVISQLPEQSQWVLRCRMDGQTHREIANRLGVSHQRAQQIDSRALAAIRQGMALRPMGQRPEK